MAGWALPENIDSTYADNVGDASVQLHQMYHDRVHNIVNKFDKDAAPASGDTLYWNGTLYVPLAQLAESETLNYPGALIVGTGVSRLGIDGGTFVIKTVRAWVNTAPTGASVILDVNKNGTTIYGTQTQRPTIAVSTFTALGGTPTVTTCTTGDYLTVDIDQVGSTIAGSDLTVRIRLVRV